MMFREALKALSHPKQKFVRGDRVRIADDLGPMMSHFTSGKDATVLHSYNDNHGCNNYKDYALKIDGKGYSAWYHEDQLTLINNKGKTHERTKHSRSSNTLKGSIR